MSQLEDYIIALCNLYGMVQKEKVVTIYNQQNEDPVTLSQVDSLIKKPSKTLTKEFIKTHEDYFVHEAILDTNQFDIMLIKKGNKPYYLPNKNVLLYYKDHEYFEKTKEYKALFQYVKRNFFKNQPEKVVWLCEEIYGNCQFGGGIKGSVEAFNAYDIIFEDEKQVNEIVELIIALTNNIRIWENNGNTPKELSRFPQKSSSEIFMESVIDSLDEESLHDVGRNDKCPCGSGKKFKMCCLKKLN